MKVKSFLKGFAAVGMAVAAAGAIPVFAEDNVPVKNGVQDRKQTFTSNDANGTGDWSTENGHNAGKIDLIYSTIGGKWKDPNKQEHANGTYLVTIPTAITYENMAIGKVETDNAYTVNVRGAIGSDNQVRLVAETGKALANGSRKNDIHETTTQDNPTWSADETFGTQLNTDGSLPGTDRTDHIKMEGTAKAAGAYTGTVSYTATLESVGGESRV